MMTDREWWLMLDMRWRMSFFYWSQRVAYILCRAVTSAFNFDQIRWSPGFGLGGTSSRQKFRNWLSVGENWAPPLVSTLMCMAPLSPSSRLHADSGEALSRVRNWSSSSKWLWHDHMHALCVHLGDKQGEYPESVCSYMPDWCAIICGTLHAHTKGAGILWDSILWNQTPHYIHTCPCSTWPDQTFLSWNRCLSICYRSSSILTMRWCSLIECENMNISSMYTWMK